MSAFSYDTKRIKHHRWIRFLRCMLAGVFLCTTSNLTAQQSQQMVRIAKISVDSTQLANYQQALQKQMKAAISLEPGVLSYYAVVDKLHPNQITILEIYADKDAYLKHIQTAHFKEYKETVKNMVLALELLDVSTFAASRKPEFLY